VDDIERAAAGLDDDDEESAPPARAHVGDDAFPDEDDEDEDAEDDIVDPESPEAIEEAVLAAFRRHAVLRQRALEIAVDDDGVLELTGRVRTERELRIARRVASRVEGVERVVVDVAVRDAGRGAVRAGARTGSDAPLGVPAHAVREGPPRVGGPCCFHVRFRAMSTSELPPQYDHAATERDLYARWQEAGDRDPFTILIPPPNVTAVLHVGHGLNNTVQDVLVRWRRMAGDEALWLPGTDHAGIATQNVVEKLLAKEGKTRFDLGRDAFVKRTEEFVEETGGQILNQLKAIGASADWSRTAYTFSPALSRAVREAFVRLWEKELVYRGHRVIHWCPRCLTSLSDEEAEFHDTESKLYHVRYPLADDPSQGITIATSRPETILADVAVAVHPEDERYAALVGRSLRLPLVGIEIPVIADAYVEKDFGTGALKITPAHDANDYEVGKRHGLAMPVVIDATGHIAAGHPDDAHRIPASLAGLERFAARKAAVAQLEAAGLLVKIDTYANSVRRCYRCDTVVEPRLSMQWFVRMEPLAKPALAAVKDGTVRLLPEKWEKVYINWLEGIGLPARDGARHQPREDVQVAGERDRSPRRGRTLRRRRAALHRGRRHGTRGRHDPRPEGPGALVCPGAQLRHQAVEHRALPAHQRRRRPRAGAGQHPGQRLHTGRRLDPWAPERGDRGLQHRAWSHAA
jgi:hypothetical protein